MRTSQDLQSAFLRLFYEYDVRGLDAFLVHVGEIDTDEARTLRMVVEAEKLAYTGSSNEALSLYQQAEERYADANDPFGLRICAGGLAAVYWRLGQYEQAIAEFARSMDSPVTDPNDLYSAFIQINLGNVFCEVGEYAQALQAYQRSLSIYEAIDARAASAGSITNIGLVYGRLDERERCLEYLHRASAIFEEVGHEAGLANVLGNIGGSYAELGDHAASLDWYVRSIALARKHSMSREIGYYVVGLAFSLFNLKRYDEAIQLLDENDDVIRQNPSPIASAQCLRALIHKDKGEYDEAKRMLVEVYDVHIARNERADAASVAKELRDLARTMGDFDGYVAYNDTYLMLEQSVKGAAAIRKLGINEKEQEIEKERKERELERQAQKAERERELAVLHSTLPRHIADRVVKGEIVNDHIDEASVMFVDIVGFTTISSRIPAGHVVHLLDSIFSECDTICTTHNVTRIKTIGDSYMAVAFPSLGDDADEEVAHHVVRAATAARQIIERLNAMELQMPGSLGDTAWVKDVGEIQVRIGLHCGPVVAGVLGKERMQYDVWGDTVNVASRMESASEPGKVHVSEAFASELKKNTEYIIQNAINESRNQESHAVSHEVSHAVSHNVSHSVSSSLVTIDRGSIDVKGKGMMQTYWLLTSGE